MLLLFDVDGTLVRCGGAGRRALGLAFEEVFGVAGALDRLRLDGSTDPLIIEYAFQGAFGRAATPPEEAQFSRVFDIYLSLLSGELRAAADRYAVYEGAVELAQAALRTGRFAMGLATGNVERGARIKLEPAGLNPYFAFGGYGSDARLRRDVVARGIERGQARAQEVLGRRFTPDEILVLGDTEHDVTAARAAGARAVGVLAGSLQPEALRAEAPDLLVESLADPALWSAVGLTAGNS